MTMTDATILNLLKQEFPDAKVNFYRNPHDKLLVRLIVSDSLGFREDVWSTDQEGHEIMAGHIRALSLKWKNKPKPTTILRNLANNVIEDFFNLKMPNRKSTIIQNKNDEMKIEIKGDGLHTFIVRLSLSFDLAACFELIRYKISLDDKVKLVRSQSKQKTNLGYTL